MTWIAAAIVGVASVAGSAISADASRRAAHTQADAAQQATDTQRSMFDTQRSDLAPWRQAGQLSLASISGMSDYMNHQFSAEDLKGNLAPNYDFMLKQGQGAVENEKNAIGGLGGNSIKAINDYTENYASNAYQQAFQNYSGQRSDIFNRLFSIAGLGGTSSFASSTGAPSFANSIGNSLGNIGQARASGIVGGANAISAGIQGAGAAGWYGLNQVGNQGGGGTGYPIGNVEGVNVATGQPTG